MTPYPFERHELIEWTRRFLSCHYQRQVTHYQNRLNSFDNINWKSLEHSLLHDLDSLHTPELAMAIILDRMEAALQDD